ncbi:MAG: Xylose isomerase protein barrel [Clostridia bacterium]|jgi:deoxyribonuclease-4|nr:Xylose isomerase protein barrel [Clostridia bacterium]
MLLFGPSGNSEIFYQQGHKSSLEMPPWLRAMNLGAYEYSCTRGVRLGPETAKKLGSIAVENNIKLSVHAPYFINFASIDPEMIKKSETYILDTVAAAEHLQADRVIVHVGSPSKADREEAYNRVYKNLYGMVEKLKLIGSKVHLCPETMGKKNQIGSLDEVLQLCLIDDSLIPTIDFGHLHAVNNGSLQKKDDFKRIFECILNKLGDKRGRLLHMHYSRVEYTEKGGEKKHWTFDDRQFGPDFEFLAECLVEYKIQGTVIAETAGTMAEDAVKLMSIYNKIKEHRLFTLENI